MDQESYHPHAFEDEIYAFWEDSGFFKPGQPEADPFCIIKPPPNVTGALHMGHALTDTIEDTIVRYKRMKGFDTLFIPGTDHAGIATQVVVERELAKEGQSKLDLGRERFLERVWTVKERHHNIIVKQMRKMGGSLDWSRECFTLDDHVKQAVKKVFVQLYKEGLIYRGERMISWCPKDETALSDLEVEQRETKGFMWRVKYMLEGDDSSYLPVETTRPETIFADTAVAVDPDDERYRRFVGKNVIVPIVGRAIPVIADSYVDSEFGSGALKVTPGHDFNDFDIGARHKLPIIQVIDAKGRMTEESGPEYKGQSVRECRKKFVAALDDAGLLESENPHVHFVGYSQRSGAVVEPRLSQQWFVATETLAKPALDAVKQESIRFIPKRWDKTYFEWMENIRDWCISRQLWWGHRIPAYFCNVCNHITVSEDDVKACEACKSIDVMQDQDVLDTWFSSALWPLVTLGWPEESADLKKFYPNQLMETGFDIIFFWVARMIMFGMKFGGDIPFKDVFFHAMVRDEKGQKMSKTKGNVVDPLELIQSHGADALRFTLASMAGQGRDVKLSKDRVEGYRNFMNKIWNAHRFLCLNTPGQLKEVPNFATLHPINQWMCLRVQHLATQMDKAFNAYQLSDACQMVYHFFWHEYCDWYLEFCKVLMNDPQTKDETSAVAYAVFRDGLKLLHPIAPFVTEKLFQALPNKDAEALIISSFPEAAKDVQDSSADQWVNGVQEIISAARRVRSMSGIPPGHKISICVDTQVINPEGWVPYITGLVRAKSVVFQKPETGVWLKAVCGTGTVYLDPEGTIDTQRELERLAKDISFIEKGRGSIERKLDNVGFTKNAPPEMVQKEHEKLAELTSKLQSLHEIKGTLEQLL